MPYSVAILLATYNGGEFLQRQLESIGEQTHGNWRLYVSDDRSTDNTVKIIRSFQSEWGPTKVSLFIGPQKGFALNFFSLLANNDVTGDLFAFCDQDDIWAPDKLTQAVKFFSTVSNKTPALYGGRSTLVDANGNIIGLSPLFRRTPCFRNALVQSIMGGNTMVMNALLRERLKNYSFPSNLPSHDWWCYLFVTAIGGVCVYEPRPAIFYRQHDHNQVGANTSLSGRLQRLALLLRGQFKEWTNIHLEMLSIIRLEMASEHLHTLLYFQKMRQGGVLLAMYYLIKSGIHRQSLAQNVMLLFAVVLRKI